MVNIPTDACPTRSRTSTTRSPELVVIFPTNVWEYDVLTSFPSRPTKARRPGGGGEGKEGHAAPPPAK